MYNLQREELSGIWLSSHLFFYGFVILIGFWQEFSGKQSP